ncbi:MAG TPA: O-antigen ligase family protein [Gemmataceae bacterium]|nr:O-antigen ligase family protein [Gemmataceae bacterium]
MMNLTPLSYPVRVAPVQGPAPIAPSNLKPGYVLGFFLFMLMNAVLFMRPTEIFPDYLYVQTYQVLIVACLVCSFPVVLQQLSQRALVPQPVTVCVLGLVLAIALSHSTRFAFEDAFDSSLEFGKVALYYLLLVGLVRSPKRLQHFLAWLVVFMLVQTFMAVLQYHGVIENRNFTTLKEEKFGSTVIRGIEYNYRLCGSGIFHNPNEICYALGMVMMICLYYTTGRASFLIRIFYLAAFVFFGYAIILTLSRGGFLGLVFGLMTFLLARFGWRKALPLAAVLLPIVFFIFAGRSTNVFDVSSDTAQNRIQLWNDALILFLRVPIFGLGTGLFREQVGLVVHNSYLQAYTELGFFGGMLFVGAFYIVLLDLHRLRSAQDQITDPELRRLRPYLMGLVGGFMGCMMSMSVTDMLPTYTVLGIVVVYLRVLNIRPPLPKLLEFNGGLVGRLVLVSMLTLVAFRLYVSFTFVVG